MTNTISNISAKLFLIALLLLAGGLSSKLNAQKRKIIGNTLIYVNESDSTEVEAETEEFDIDKYFNPNISDEERALHKKNIQQFTDRIKANPNDVSAYVNRGAYYSYLGLYPQAIKDYDKAIELYPGIPEVWYNRGLAKARFVYSLDACKDLKKAEGLGLAQAKGVIIHNCGRYRAQLESSQE